MDRRSFVTSFAAKFASILSMAGMGLNLSSTAETTRLSKDPHLAKFPHKLFGGNIPTAEDFTVLLAEGVDDFMLAFQRADGAVVIEEAPFDRNDPMSYVLMEIVMKNPMVRIYQLSGDRYGKSPEDRIIPFIYRG
jgi:hypothetical protein